ncbi:hypothetical protein Y032_0028g1690 [Ancylostoma ceylanicum]|uniref:Uncharacterized protein n=1 Tax=Ancylostoma ceylanicum TaxID=53326 RepID=A0A016UTK6_9BILA|nr:hypothetical protein Y032_0028g1690 [Ancylostoma ceylanicum]
MLTQIGTNVDPLYVKNESHSTLVRSVPYLGAEVVSAVKQSYYDDPSLTGRFSVRFRRGWYRLRGTRGV